MGAGDLCCLGLQGYHSELGLRPQSEMVPFTRWLMAPTLS